MEHAYAQALWTTVERGATPAKAVGALRTTLERQGRLALLPKIGHAFRRIAERQQQRTGISLFVASEKDAKSAANAAAGAIEKLGAHAKEFDVKVDGSLIGGWRLEGAGILVDRSFKKQLLDMYQRVTR
jgi:F0F1-type ATP synthase delta subunit